MSKLARACIFGAMLAAMNLAGMAAVAQAQASDEPASEQDARRPPTEGQVGETWRHRQVAPAVSADTRRPPTEGQVGESWHQRVSVAARPAEPSGQPGGLVLGLGVLAAVLALVAGLAVQAAKRAGRKVPAGLAKLGVGSRRQAASAARGLGATRPRDMETTTASQLVAEARARISNLTVEQVAGEIGTGNVVLVDLREPGELAEQGAIAGAVHAPRGMLEFYADPTSPYHRSELDPSARTILYCASGGRSALACELLGQFGYADVAHLDGGFKAWKAAGEPVLREGWDVGQGLAAVHRRGRGVES